MKLGLVIKQDYMIKTRIKQAVDQSHITPTLAIVVVGDNPASATYVNNKKRDCAECGITAFQYSFLSYISEEYLWGQVATLSADDNIDGIIVQLPLPDHIDPYRIMQAIDPDKDVDCLTPYNTGLLMQGIPRFIPCTPMGVMRLLPEYQSAIQGKHCVVVGRSDIVGKPVAQLALKANATVTMCHSYTTNLDEICRSADILITAVGIPGFIRPDMVKNGVAVIDVGINRNAVGKLVGDCDPAVYEKSAAYTPVPGGVGPMTRAMLMYNVALAAGVIDKSFNLW